VQPARIIVTAILIVSVILLTAIAGGVIWLSVGANEVNGCGLALAVILLTADFGALRMLWFGK